MAFLETMAKLIERYNSFFTEGIVNTLIIAAFSVLFGAILGTLRHSQTFQILVGHGDHIVGAEHQVGNADHGDNGGFLDDGDEFVAQRRENIADGLGQDHMDGGLDPGHAQRPARLHLARVHREGAAAMNIFTAIGQFFTNWGAKLASTFLEDDRYMMLVDGLRNTAIITLGALCIGIVIGALVAIIKYCGEGSRAMKPLCVLCDIYTTVIRGIPVVVLLLTYGLGKLRG